MFSHLLSGSRFGRMLTCLCPRIPFRVVTRGLGTYGAGLSFRLTFTCSFIRNVLGGTTANYRVSYTTVSGAHGCAFVDGRHSVILSSTVLSMVLVSGNFGAAYRVTVNSGLLSLP